MTVSLIVNAGKASDGFLKRETAIQQQSGIRYLDYKTISPGTAT